MICKYYTCLLQVLTMVSECTWQEVQVELELWTRMAGVALRQTKFEMVGTCSQFCIVYVWKCVHVE